MAPYYLERGRTSRGPKKTRRPVEAGGFASVRDSMSYPASAQTPPTARIRVVRGRAWQMPIVRICANIVQSV
jgi:hypothetical protein